MITFNVQINNLAALREKFAAAPVITTGALQEAILVVPEILASVTVPPIVPYRTGQLAQTFFSTVNAFTATWGPTVNYAAAVEFGTKPHKIVPVNKKALFWQGAKHPVRSVNHPGSRANPYMERIIEQASPLINDVFDQALASIISALSI